MKMEKVNIFRLLYNCIIISRKNNISFFRLLDSMLFVRSLIAFSKLTEKYAEKNKDPIAYSLLGTMVFFLDCIQNKDSKAVFEYTNIMSGFLKIKQASKSILERVK